MRHYFVHLSSNVQGNYINVSSEYIISRGQSFKQEHILRFPALPSLFPESKMMDTFDHAVGPEKFELIAKQQGNDVSIHSCCVMFLNPRHQRAIEFETPTVPHPTPQTQLFLKDHFSSGKYIVFLICTLIYVLTTSQ